MRKNSLVALLLAVLFCLPTQNLFAKSKFWKMMDWFKRKHTSTTVVGQVDSVDGRKVMFKTVDGQTLQLTGRKAELIGEKRGAKIRIFGNIQKPGAKFPTGGLTIRNFKILEAAPEVPAEPEPIVEPETAPEPYLEPEPVPEPYPVEPEPVVDTEVTTYEPGMVPPVADVPAPIVEPEPVAEPEPQPTTTKYVVEAGDTLAKISSKMYGTTRKWKEIASHNSITNPRSLRVGMTLEIPQK